MIHRQARRFTSPRLRGEVVSDAAGEGHLLYRQLLANEPLSPTLSPQTAANGERDSMTEKTRFMLALIAPAAVVLVLFQVVPILTGANASFRDWSLHDPKRTWVGLANYAHVLSDPEFLGTVLPNTFGFMIASVVCSLVLGLLVALMLNK